jgi:AraC-like DNA-binding protein/quercetin dioxygenase-like cupin family protein
MILDFLFQLGMPTFGQSISIIDLFMKHQTTTSPDFFSPQVARARRFYLDLNPPRRAQLTVVCGGVEHCAPDYQVQRDSFPFHSIEYVAHGNGQLKLGRRSFELRAGSVFSYAPGIAQHITSERAKPLVKYFVNFTGTRSGQWLRRHKLSAGTLSQIFPPAEIQPLFDELVRNGQRGTRQTPQLCRQLLECLGVKLLEARAPLKGSDSPAFTTYQNCREHIRANFARLRTLEQIAREIHVDAAYVCRLFRRFDHQPPYRFLMRLKMNAAAGQLAQPGALIKNVAVDLGFANPFHFSRVFKSCFAVSPDAFRKIR